jgi:hypothetical protein
MSLRVMTMTVAGASVAFCSCFEAVTTVATFTSSSSSSDRPLKESGL